MRGDANDLTNKALQSMHTCGNGKVGGQKYSNKEMERAGGIRRMIRGKRERLDAIQYSSLAILSWGCEGLQHCCVSLSSF